MTPKRIGFVLLPGFSMVTLSAAAEPFRAINALSGEQLYSISAIGVDPGLVRSSSGFFVMPELSIDEAAGFAIVFMVSSVEFADFYCERAADWLRRQARGGGTLAPLGSAVVFAAKAGLLDGYRCATHRRLFSDLPRRFPKVAFTRDLFEIDRDRMTCAGGTAALDLILALLARDHGSDKAADVAEELLHTRLPSVTESQRMAVEWRYHLADKRLVRAIALMEQNLERPVPLTALAAAAALSSRQFQRLFTQRLGTPPSRFYLALRLKHARALLLSSTAAIFTIALDCGFSDASHFTRCYRAFFGETPGRIRRRQNGEPPARPPLLPDGITASTDQKLAQTSTAAAGK